MRLLGLTLLICFTIACGAQRSFEQEPMINGVSFVGGPNPVDASHFNSVKSIHANYITLMPFAYGDLGKPNIRHSNLNWQWWGESAEGTEKSILVAHEQGLSVMIKPQLWLDWGSFTGNQEFDSEADWVQFENDYREFIMIYAEMSQKHNLPMFCIGTELCAFAEQRPEYWKNLISDIRRIYDGKLTYAANWDSYKRMPFWDDLDYIGVDAYFPLNNDVSPTQEEFEEGWSKWVNQLEQYSSDYGKKILFTEWGYRSNNYTGEKPWETGKGQSVNLESQSNAYRATFNQFWNKPWFAGGFVWKWFPNHDKSGGAADNRFTPQNKPAEEVLRQEFGQ
ncbi:MAG: glycoside hydrolase [Flavobacteriales bacterium]|nr:glycoside hydrolase [Flavobacteriales bacterium]